ncbi:MAG: hypothetical protein M1833_004291 [Piccolia ochrophora]|nr:MAG: hypothetical protein M1833_004291 [Piccolia ochrophora]
MALDNDTRGWIMSCVSGVACVLGSSVICVDYLVRLFPGKRNFKIQDSNTFLSASLSLSFGVMLFSALYSMLPSAKTSLKKGGFSPQVAEYILIGCFLGGVIGIQIISRLMHHFIPSHVVDCDHTHDAETEGKSQELPQEGDNHRDHEPPYRTDLHSNRLPSTKHSHQSNGDPLSQSASESTPLLPSINTHFHDSNQPHNSSSLQNLSRVSTTDSPTSATSARRPSLHVRLTTQVSSLVSGPKASCARNGSCYGYSDVCGQESCKHLHSKAVDGQQKFSTHVPRAGGLSRRSTAPYAQPSPTTALPDLAEEPSSSSHSLTRKPSHSSTPPSTTDLESGSDDAHQPSPSSHHHHVPQNAFLSIGLQTSIAIALHKLPEGFITFATNHANPKLGFSVFMALFIHNLTEGFALALPLYLALGSRWKAMLWSSLLGGVSQPLGAGVAAVWLQVAGRGDLAPGEGVYGGMFAVTSGIMTSVALQLFSESLGLNHNRSLCITFAFVGMAILGFSFALTAD